jgi:hypothetical protein
VLYLYQGKGILKTKEAAVEMGRVSSKSFSRHVKERTGMGITELRKELRAQGVPLNDIDNIMLKGMREDFEKSENKEKRIT